MIHHPHSKLFVITMIAGFALAIFALFFTQAFAATTTTHLRVRVDLQNHCWQ